MVLVANIRNYSDFRLGQSYLGVWKLYLRNDVRNKNSASLEIQILEINVTNIAITKVSIICVNKRYYILLVLKSQETSVARRFIFIRIKVVFLVEISSLETSMTNILLT